MWKFLYNERLTVDYNGGEILQRIRDFLCKRNGTYDYSLTGIGWTLHDSYYAIDEDNLSVDDYIVVYSPGEDGEVEMYWQIKWDVTALVNMFGCLYWDNVTHTAVKPYGTASQGFTIGAAQYLHIYGDLDHFYFLNDSDPADGNCACYNAGRFQTVLHVPPIVSVGSLSAGSDVVITVPDATLEHLAPGRGLYIHDEAEMEVATVKTNNGITQITVDLSNSYSAGARLRSIMPYIQCNDTGTFMAGTGNDTIMLISGTGAYPHNGANTAFGAISEPLPDLGHFNGSPFQMYDGSGGIDKSFNNLLYTSSLTGISYLDVFEDVDGGLWRYFLMGGKGVFLREA